MGTPWRAPLRGSSRLVLASAVTLGPLAGSVASPVYAQAKAVHVVSSPAGHKPFCIGYTPAKVCLSWTGATVTATWTGDKWAKTERLVALQARPVKAGQPGKVLPGRRSVSLQHQNRQRPRLDEPLEPGKCQIRRVPSDRLPIGALHQADAQYRRRDLHWPGLDGLTSAFLVLCPCVEFRIYGIR